MGAVFFFFRVHVNFHIVDRFPCSQDLVQHRISSVYVRSPGTQFEDLPALADPLLLPGDPGQENEHLILFYAESVDVLRFIK